MSNATHWKQDPATVEAIFALFLQLLPDAAADARQVATARAVVLAVYAGVPANRQDRQVATCTGHPAAVHPADRLAAGQATPGDLAALGAGIRAYRLAAGAVPLERCLRLERTPREHERAERDRWLRQALELLVPRARSRVDLFAMLLQDWQSFLTGNLWRAWRDDEQPPEDAAPSHVALFHASRLNRGEALTDRQLRNLFGNEFASRFP